MEPQESISMPGAPLPAGMCWALLLTSVAWMTVMMAAGINALHAQSLQSIHHVREIILGLMTVMILSGAVGAALGLDGLLRRRGQTARAVAIGVWLAALCVAAGAAAWGVKSHHWPWVELLPALVVAVLWRFLKRPRNSTAEPR